MLFRALNVLMTEEGTVPRSSTPININGAGLGSRLQLVGETPATHQKGALKSWKWEKKTKTKKQKCFTIAKGAKWSQLTESFQ